ERGAQHVLRAVDVHVQYLVGIGDVVLDPHQARQVVDEVGLRRKAVENFRIHDGVHHQSETRLLEQVADLGLGTRIERNDRVASGEECLREVGSEKTRAAGYENLQHRSCPPSRSPTTSPTRAANSRAGSSSAPASCTWSRSSAPVPAATRIP